MPTDRVLVEIVTAANMGGVEAANAGFLKMHASTLALAAGIGILVVVGKSAIENYEAQEKAHKNLKQATDVSGQSFGAMQKAFDDWAQANKRYIPDQYAAEEALAAFVRAGAKAPEAMRELNDALDLSTLRGIDMAEAQKNITLALAGNSRGLKVLGITTDEYNAIMKNDTLTNEQKHSALLALIETKTKDGRKAQTDMSQSTQALNKDWQDISAQAGPSLTGMLSGIVDRGDKILTWMMDVGKNDKWWKSFNDGLINIVRAAQDAWYWLNLVSSLGASAIPASQDAADARAAGYARAARGGRAAGGPVDPYQVYTVGEHGPETLVMGGAGGTVIPHGMGMAGPASVHIHIDQGAYMDGPSVDRLANKVAQRLRYAPGT